MPLYRYINKKHKTRNTILKIISFSFIIIGLGIMIWVLYPIVSFEIYYAPRFTELIKPIPQDIIKNSIADLPSVLGTENTDYTKASVWFPKALSMKVSSNITSYTLSIYKLGISDAHVIVNGEDLDKSLIHYSGNLPGENGNPVIFGHSTLLWFYNPKDYKSIFSKLPELKKDDEIVVKVDNISYKYKVFDLKIVYPDDISVLEERTDNSYITLVTCVPPGTFMKRLIVRGKLAKI